MYLIELLNQPFWKLKVRVGDKVAPRRIFANLLLATANNIRITQVLNQSCRICGTISLFGCITQQRPYFAAYRINGWLKKSASSELY